MKTTLAYAGVAAASLLATACATSDHQTARLEAARTLANAQSVDFTHHEAIGRTAVAYGDRWTAANLFERAVDKEATVTGWFNLAATYEQTGRAAQAIPLYQRVVQHGQFLWGVNSRDYRDRAARLERFNLADESAARLARLTQRPTFAASGVRSATELGTPAAATVGAATATRISDAEALARDAGTQPVVQ
jgi:tetratricopeptide (TPR) repeat protein